MPTMNLADQQLHYLDTRSGDEVLLILPDHMHAVSAYKNEIDHFESDFRVITLDYPGTGRSTRDLLYEDERLLDIWDNRSDWAMYLLIELGVRSCVVLGVGGGGRSALHFAGYHAKLHGFTVEAVVADSFLARLDGRTMHRQLDRREHYYVRKGKALREQHGDDWREVVDADTAMLRRIADRGGYDLPLFNIKSIDCPVLLTGSLGDPLTDGIAREYARLSSMIADCTVYLDPTAEHPFCWKKPRDFRSVVDMFLARD